MSKTPNLDKWIQKNEDSSYITDLATAIKADLSQPEDILCKKVIGSNGIGLMICAEKKPCRFHDKPEVENKCVRFKDELHIACEKDIKAIQITKGEATSVIIDLPDNKPETKAVELTEDEREVIVWALEYTNRKYPKLDGINWRAMESSFKKLK